MTVVRERPVDLQLSVEDGAWADEETLAALSLKAIGAAADVLAGDAGAPVSSGEPELSMLFTDDAAMRAINAEWRDKDKPTNVLSFPAAFSHAPDGTVAMLGDIVLAYETIANEAKDLERSFDDHLAHLIIHGYLHLLGYDHIDASEAGIMEALETRILATLGISDPYGDTEPK